MKMVRVLIQLPQPLKAKKLRLVNTTELMRYAVAHYSTGSDVAQVMVAHEPIVQPPQMIEERGEWPGLKVGW
jgi:hypothetical protein